MVVAEMPFGDSLIPMEHVIIPGDAMELDDNDAIESSSSGSGSTSIYSGASSAAQLHSMDDQHLGDADDNAAMDPQDESGQGSEHMEPVVLPIREPIDLDCSDTESEVLP